MVPLITKTHPERQAKPESFSSVHFFFFSLRKTVHVIYFRCHYRDLQPQLLPFRNETFFIYVRFALRLSDSGFHLVRAEDQGPDRKASTTGEVMTSH